MKYLIPILLIVFVSCGNAEDEYELISENKEVDKKICFEAFKKGKVVDKQIEVQSGRRGIQEARNTVTDIIYKNKYYTLSVLRYEWIDSNNQLPSSIKCRVYEETKKIKKKE
jgi:hypothetical protein